MMYLFFFQTSNMHRNKQKYKSSKETLYFNYTKYFKNHNFFKNKIEKNRKHETNINEKK
jgi:hypothetical protein